MKRALLLIGGGCWFLFSLGLGWLLLEYLTGGAGFQVFGMFFSSTSVLLGMVPFIGLIMAAGLSFSIGAALCAHGIVGEPKERPPESKPPGLPGSR